MCMHRDMALPVPNCFLWACKLSMQKYPENILSYVKKFDFLISEEGVRDFTSVGPLRHDNNSLIIAIYLVRIENVQTIVQFVHINLILLESGLISGSIQVIQLESFCHGYFPLSVHCKKVVKLASDAATDHYW